MEWWTQPLLQLNCVHCCVLKLYPVNDLAHDARADNPFLLIHVQIGPRLEMQIVKTEEGLCDGAVLYHAHVQKSAEEAGQQQQEVDEKEALRAQRRRQQVGVVDDSVIWCCGVAEAAANQKQIVKTAEGAV